MDTVTKLTAGGNGAIGYWLIAAPFVFGAPAIGRWNDVLVGTAMALVGSYNCVRAATGRPANAAGAGLVAVLGCWLVVAPFALGLEGPAMWIDVGAGTVAASFGSYNAYAAAVADRVSAFRATAE